MSNFDIYSDFVDFVVKSMVEFKDDVNIEVKSDDLGILIELRVNNKDAGRVIGKSGQNIKSIRTLLRVIGANNGGERVNLKLIES